MLEGRCKEPGAHLRVLNARDRGAIGARGAEAVAALRACIDSGGVALIPTDTVYGLACDPQSAEALERLYEIKGRPAWRPAAVMFFSLAAALAAIGDRPAAVKEAICRLLPGPVTLLIDNPTGLFPLACDPQRALGVGVAQEAGGSAQSKRAGRTDEDRSSSQAPALGIRVPALPTHLAALERLERPLLQSSANRTGEADAGELSLIEPQLRAAADLVLDGGALVGCASTVIDLRGYERERSYRVLREGPLSAAQIARELGRAHTC
jgi:L-threonylcarbamoyladenylate synthase